MRFALPSLLAGLALLGACGGSVRPGPVTPAELASLEEERSRFPDDHEVLTRVGIRFYDAHAYDRARDALTAALRAQPSFTAAVYLGLIEEALGRFDEAERNYRIAESLSIAPTQRRELERRMAAFSQVRLTAEARQALARESTLSRQPPVPNSLAVLPWTFIGTDATLEPLGVGVAHLMVSDLSRISSLTLIERERVQALLDEMAMTGAGRVDTVTAARAGRLLRASRVLHGIVRQTQGGIQLEATVISGDGLVLARSGGGDRLDDLFSLEKTVLLDLVSQLGIPVSPAEQRALRERPAQDLQTFLAFSRGLEAEGRPDAGPNSLLRVASPVYLATGAMQADALRAAIQVIAPSAGGEVDRRTRLPVANSRLPEALGQDNPSKLAFISDILLLIPRP
jgi:TolB-like protein